jgi:hypothetical protein
MMMKLPAGAGPAGLARAGRGRRTRPVASTPTPAPFLPPLAEFATEAARMRAAAGAPERDRRVLLADLASRLEALLRPRHPHTVGGSAGLASLRELLAELRGDAALRMPTDRFTHLWTRMQELLDELAGTAAPPPPSPPPSPPRRPDFWKRP